MLKYILTLSAFLLISSHAFATDERLDNICDVTDATSLYKKKLGKSPDYALVKDGTSGCYEHLLTVHGYADDKSVCEGFASRINKEGAIVPGFFFCIQLNR